MSIYYNNEVINTIYLKEDTNMNAFFCSKSKRIPKYELIEVSDMEKEDHAEM